MFKAILLQQTDDKKTRAELVDQDDSALPDPARHEVTVDVAWSTLNFKDALAITGKGPVVRKFPLVAGIDLAGTVEASDDARFKPGDAVDIESIHRDGARRQRRQIADHEAPAVGDQHPVALPRPQRADHGLGPRRHQAGQRGPRQRHRHRHRPIGQLVAEPRRQVQEQVGQPRPHRAGRQDLDLGPQRRRVPTQRLLQRQRQRRTQRRLLEQALVASDDRERGDADRDKYCGAGAALARDPRQYATFMRLAFRSSLQARYTTANLGFRCAADLPRPGKGP